MKFIPIKTRIFNPPRDNIYDLFDAHLPSLIDSDILVITSKIAAVHQGKCIKIDASVDKQDLIKKYADLSSTANDQGLILSLKENTLICNAGIDESNGNGYYVLWPKNPNKFAKNIYKYLKDKYDLKKLGIIITDSHCIPCRRGVLGVSIGFYGFRPVINNIGRKDIFGRVNQMSTSNIVDTLAAMAVLLMGECDEKQPLLLIRGTSDIEFTDKNTSDELVMPLEEDIFFSILKNFKK